MGNHLRFPSKTMHTFVETLATEVGADTLSAVLAKAGLPIDWASPSFFTAMNDDQAAQVYSKLQAALRTYYGRGARGILLRIGSKVWERLLNDASLGLKTQAIIVRGLPTVMRRKAALDLLPKLVNSQNGEMTVHTLDLDLLFVDHTSPTTLAQSDSAPICYVTLGMIRECLFWAVGYEHDIEEISCRALGAQECEFKITVGG